MRVSWLLASIAVFFALGTLPARAATAATTALTIAPATGTPSVSVAVSGTGFGASEAVDVYVDLVDTLLLVSSSSGSISGSVLIPATASPGTHYVTAIGRKSGDAAQTTYTATTPWDQFGYGNSHLGTNPFENTLTGSNVSSAGVLWSYPSNGEGGTVAVAGGRAFVSTYNGIEALSVATGAFLWRYESAQDFPASPAVSNGVVYVGSVTGTMFALNAATSAKLWTANLPSPLFASATVVNGVVYVAASDTVYALSAATGSVLWSYTTGAAVDASPSVVGGVVYIGSEDDKVYALNATTGGAIWTYATGGEVESSPAVANGVVYVGSDDHKVYAIEALGKNPGTLLWSFSTGSDVYESPAATNGLVFVGSADGNEYALNAFTGTTVWSLSTAQVVRSACVANGIVYFTSENGAFYAVAASTGALLSAQITGVTYVGSPSISDGVEYLSVVGGNTYAFSLTAKSNVRRAGPPAFSSLHPDLRLPVTASFAAPTAAEPVAADVSSQANAANVARPRLSLARPRIVAPPPPQRYSGVLELIRNSVLAIRLSNGRLLYIDDSRAFARHRLASRLSVGDVLKAEGDLVAGNLLATSVETAVPSRKPRTE
jgi:outer membrane protein assembly factor BamB